MANHDFGPNPRLEYGPLRHFSSRPPLRALSLLSSTSIELLKPLMKSPRSGGAIAYDKLQPMVVASHNLSAGRPCERRDPSPLAPKVKKGLCSSAETRVRAAAMSAIALTLGSLRS